MRFRNILLLLSLVLWALPCQGLEVTFKPEADIGGDTVCLGDIVDLSDSGELATALASQVIGPAPEPGQATVVDARAVIAAIEREHGIRHELEWKGAAGITIRRKTITIGPEKIAGIIAAYIESNRSRLPAADIQFVPDALPLPFAVPTGTLSWEVVPSSPAIIGSSRFALICKVDGRVRKNFSIRGRTEAMAPVVVATRDLKYGEMITPDSISVARRDLAGLENYTAAPDEVVGSLVKRTIRTGAAVDTASVERPPIIKRGELVKIFVNHNGLLVTATGIARTNGRRDEVIRVQNSSSNKLIYCRVQAPGIVEVAL